MGLCTSKNTDLVVNKGKLEPQSKQSNKQPDDILNVDINYNGIPIVEPHSVNIRERFIIRNKIGQGENADVFLAKDIILDKIVVLKTIKGDDFKQKDVMQFKAEASLLKKMNHPNIIKVLDFVVDSEKQDTYYIVMEHVRGGELFDEIVSRSQYGENDAKEVIRTVAQALAYCHSNGIIHRDLKPENILLQDKFDARSLRISDFGFAYNTSNNQNPNTLVGTPLYIAPEVLAMKGHYGSAIDMWSLGVIMYILLCGSPPFYADNAKELFRQIKAGDISFVTEKWNDKSAEAKDLILKLLVVNPDMRYTAEQVLSHPWLNMSSSSENSLDIQEALHEFQLTQRRRWRKTITSVMFTNLVSGRSLTDHSEKNLIES